MKMLAWIASLSQSILGPRSPYLLWQQLFLTVICCHACSRGGNGTKSTLGKRRLFLPGGWAPMFPGQRHQTFRPPAVTHSCHFLSPHVQYPVACEGKAAALHCQPAGSLPCLNPVFGKEERFLRYGSGEGSSCEANRERQSQGQWQREEFGWRRSHSGLYQIVPLPWGAWLCYSELHRKVRKISSSLPLVLPFHYPIEVVAATEC